MERIASFLHEAQVSKAQEILQKETIDARSTVSTITSSKLDSPFATYAQNIQYDLEVDENDVLKARELIETNETIINCAFAKPSPQERPIPNWIGAIIIIGCIGMGAYMVISSH